MADVKILRCAGRVVPGQGTVNLVMFSLVVNSREQVGLVQHNIHRDGRTEEIVIVNPETTMLFPDEIGRIYNSLIRKENVHAS